MYHRSIIDEEQQKIVPPVTESMPKYSEQTSRSALNTFPQPPHADEEGKNQKWMPVYLNRRQQPAKGSALPYAFQRR